MKYTLKRIGELRNCDGELIFRVDVYRRPDAKPADDPCIMLVLAGSIYPTAALFPSEAEELRNFLTSALDGLIPEQL